MNKIINIKQEAKRQRFLFWISLLTGQIKRAKQYYINLKWFKQNEKNI